MKKLILISLALVLVFSLSACDPTQTNSSSSETSKSIIATTTTSAEPEMLNGTLYGVFSADSIKETDFGYEAGKLTPERIAEALSAWTDMKFEIKSEVDSRNKKVLIKWQADSSFALGAPDPQKEEFFFYEVDTFRSFMLNTLSYTIRKNLGEDYDVYYSLIDISGIDLGTNLVEIHDQIAYNKIDDPTVFG